MKSGTGDVKKIDRLRRASLQPDSKGPSAQKAQDDAEETSDTADGS
eukprot:COSAG06_NODE_28480_length_573_cov_1.324895_1_plen_45_part_10